MKNVFEACVALAAAEFGIVRTADGWKRKFLCIQKEYGAKKALPSGSAGDGSDGKKLPAYYDVLHELLCDKAQDDIPAAISSEDIAKVEEVDAVITSTQKRAKRVELRIDWNRRAY